MNQNSIFYTLPCLTEHSSKLSAEKISKKWFGRSDSRYIDRTIQDFIQLNKELFNFLKITPMTSGSYRNLGLSFRTENFIGAIPLRSPNTGKIFADFIVYPRYLENKGKENVNEYIEIIHLLDEMLSPEFLDSYELVTKNHVRPPIYFECMKFLDLFLESLKENWVKFDSYIEKFNYPKNRIDWKTYINYEWNPQKKFDYPCQTNYLTTKHDEFRELFYVFEIAKSNLLDTKTPEIIRYDSRKKISFINKTYPSIQPKIIRKIRISNADPIIIKRTKEQAKKILEYEVNNYKPWRVDFLNIFEKYIQYIFSKICTETNWQFKNNYKFSQTTERNFPFWTLKYLEPDMVLHKEYDLIVVDAKYKSHLYNRHSDTEYLREEHRADLHQIAAYCAFETKKNKMGILCYPSSDFFSKDIIYKNRINNVNIFVSIFGVPITASDFKNVYSNVKEKFISIKKNKATI